MKSNYKLIRQLIKEDKISAKDLENIIVSYSNYGLSKKSARTLINTFEKILLKNIGILQRDTSDEIKNKIKSDYNLENLIVKNEDKENIDQNLKIGDLVYTFRVKDKLSRLK